MKHQGVMFSAACVAFAALGCTDAATAPNSLSPHGFDATAGAQPADVMITFVSDPSWGAQYVCLAAGNPADCPAGATLYGYGGPGGWGTDLSTIPGAHWIWASGVHGSSTSYPAVHSFTKTFELAGMPIGGSISVSADDFAEVFANGTLVGSLGSVTHAPDATMASTTLTTFDLGPYLATGTNVITIRAANGNFGCGSIAYSCNPGAVVFAGWLRYHTETPAAPVVTSIALPPEPVAVGSAAQLGAAFTDQNTGDAHTGTFSWETGSVSAIISEHAGSGTATAAQVFQVPGVHAITATITDGALSGNRSSTEDTPAYLVVYDASAGFVTGGGWIPSPEGACRLTSCTEATAGPATFGFTARYARGASVPDGSAAFRFHAGNLAFASRSYAWLVVAGARAQFKGVGTINGAEGYGFLITAIDGELSGGEAGDRFRIKIWNVTSGAVVYDNQMDAAENGEASTALGGGSIRIHR